MTEYIVNRPKDDAVKFMKTKAEKMGLQCEFEKEKVTVTSKPGWDMKSQTPIPVMFKGKITQVDSKTKISGRFSYGFYLTTLVIVAIVLIVVRFAWSLYQNQTENIILCLIVATMLLIVCIVVRSKGKELKGTIEELLGGLDKKQLCGAR